MAKKVDEYLKYYRVSVHPNMVCVTPAFEHCRRSSKAIQESDESDNVAPVKEPKKVVFNIGGVLSRPTKSKINRAVTYLNHVACNKSVTRRWNGRDVKFRLCFVTLTLSSMQVHSDNELKSKLINHFFVEAKQRWGVAHYVWRAEKQGNGNLHIHILTDKFIPFDELRNVWNRIQNKLGYVDRYAQKMSSLTYAEYSQLFKGNNRYTSAMVRNAWVKGRATNWRHPNSTDIHGLDFVNDVTAYICKYMRKDGQVQDLEGRLWGCSHSLSNLTGGRDVVDSSISDELNNIAAIKGVRHLKDDFFDIFFIDVSLLESAGAVGLLGMLNDFLRLRFST